LSHFISAASGDEIAISSSDRWLNYGPDEGDARFRDSLASFLSTQYHYSVSSKHLCITTGVSQGVQLVARALTTPGDIILVENPTYYLIASIFESLGLRVIGIPTDQHGMCLSSLEELVLRYRPKIVYTIPTCNNPRGYTTSAASRRKLVELAERHRFWVLADEVYQMLHFPLQSAPMPLRHPSISLHGDDPSASLNDCSRIISVSSFAKILAPGMRVGWIEAAPAVVLAASGDGAVRSGGCMAQFSSSVVHEVLANEGAISSYIHTLRELFAARHDAVIAAVKKYLPTVVCHQATGGYFVWLQFPNHVDCDRLLALASEKHNVKSISGRACAVTVPDLARPLSEVGTSQLSSSSASASVHDHKLESCGNDINEDQQLCNCIRICFARQSSAALTEGVRRLGAALRQYNAATHALSTRVQLFFDVISPYSWIAFEILTRYRDIWSIDLELVPVFLGGIMAASGNRPPASVPAKGMHLMTDLERLRVHTRVPLKLPSRFQQFMGGGTLHAMRLLTAASVHAPTLVESLTREIWTRVWSRDEPISPDTFPSILSHAGVPQHLKERLLSACSSVDIKSTLKANTQEAVEAGAFGAPTILIHLSSGVEMIFGSDRFPVMAELLEKPWLGPCPNTAVLPSKL
jgi:2-aminoadipate transaminase